MISMTLGIRQRVLIIALVPLLFITFLLGGYFISTRLDDAQSALMTKGQIMSQMMATSAEFGLLTRNKEILDNLIRSSIKSDEVNDIVFLSPNFEEITRASDSSAPLNKDAGYPLLTKDQAIFLPPVVATGVDFTDESDFFNDSEPEFIGWVAIALSLEPTKNRQEEILFKGVLLALIGLIITFIIAYRFGQRITNPILGLTHVVDMLKSGNLETRASLSSTGELRSLAQGVNKLAQQVQESNFTLESQVDKATKRLRSTLVHLEKQNQALDKSRKRADNANVAKDEFLARMSHELRTPLTSVSGFTRLLEQTELNTDQKEYTRIINLTSGLLLSIIDDILDYSKLESNAIELENIPFDFESCVMDVMEMQTATAHEKGLELIPVIAPNTPKFLIGDPIRMRQILTNLVSNAVKFTTSGYVSINVSTVNLSSIDCELNIVVEDTGAGIPKDRVQNLFKAFSQADTSITRRFGGSGLGLVIAKRLTELMAGSIYLESTEGKGTRVTLNIPMAASTRQKAKPHNTLSHLIIYDEQPLMRSALTQQLDKAADQILNAESLEVLSELQQKHTNAPIIFGTNSQSDESEQIVTINEILFSGKNKLLILSAKPLPIRSSPRIVQLRKPARTQLLLNALSPDSYKLPTDEHNERVNIKHASRILVAEDNNFNRLLIRRILEQTGSEVIEATTGEEALKACLASPPDIILMDVHMPVMDGIEATRQIRLTLLTTPIIALTANVIASEHQKLIQAGVNHVLLKPINDQELCDTINRYVSTDTSFTLPAVAREQDNSQLEKYDIDNETLNKELLKQLDGLFEGFNQQDLKLMRHHSHQLSGLAGLYELPELEAAGFNLHEALIAENIKKIWKEVWQIKRIIEHHQYDESEPL